MHETSYHSRFPTLLDTCKKPSSVKSHPYAARQAKQVPIQKRKEVVSKNIVEGGHGDIKTPKVPCHGIEVPITEFVIEEDVGHHTARILFPLSQFWWLHIVENSDMP